jgi:hypothetical protein
MMDLVDVLKKKIDVLDDGEHRPGLKAVLLHIETAFRHLSRGQDGDDDTAFTDAIYRTNQAFEGSVKEAYRVLTGNEPSKKRPYDIESYLEKNNIFRPRVLSQLTNYRTEWRNPSAHDYKLDFDESEAFLAIVSVSAFACLLLDQISERLSYTKSQAEADAQKAVLLASLKQTKNADLIVKASELLSEFCASHMPFDDSNRLTETQVLGALHGFLASVAPELKVETEVSVEEVRSFRADLVISQGGEKLVVELRRSAMRQHHTNSIVQLERYLFASSIKSGIILFYPDAPHRMEKHNIKTNNPDYKLVMLAPLGSLSLL